MPTVWFGFDQLSRPEISGVVSSIRVLESYWARTPTVPERPGVRLSSGRRVTTLIEAPMPPEGIEARPVL